MGMDQITLLTFISLAPSFDKHKTFKKTFDIIQHIWINLNIMIINREIFRMAFFAITYAFQHSTPIYYYVLF